MRKKLSNTYTGERDSPQILQHPDTGQQSDPLKFQLHIETNLTSDSDDHELAAGGHSISTSNKALVGPTGSAPHLKKLKSDDQSTTKGASFSKTRYKIRRFLEKFFVLLCLAVLIPAAFYYPIGHEDGPLHPHITSEWIATCVLFFGFSLGLKLEYISRVCAFWQCNIFTHFITYGYYPLIGLLIYQAAIGVPHDLVSHDMHALLEGIIILCCLPATGSSSIVFTINAGGNEGAAAITCTVSAFIGIFASPALIYFVIGTETHINTENIYWELGLKVIAPFFTAQFIRLLMGETGRNTLKYNKNIIKKINEIALLYIVFCILSESFHVGVYPNISDICVGLCLLILLHAHGYLALWILSGCFRGCLLNKSKSCFMAFTIYDRIACIYTGVSKSIVIGIPLIKCMYGHDHIVGMYILPVLFYYPICLIVGSIMVENLRKLTMKEKRFLSTYTSTFTELSLGTDYGALSPFTCKIENENSFLFAPFALPTPKSKIAKAPLMWSSTR